jgi:NAD(P)-dependent dehydrogenase (short-subunit alcohol dehydrogenase family)
MNQNNVAIITGAASGIGRATAIAFSVKGVRVTVSDIQEEKLNETARLIEENGGEVLTVKADVSKEDDVRNLMRKTEDTFGRLDYLCNNAGVGGELNATASYTTEEWDRVINVNLRGQWLCMKHAIPAMLTSGGGSIVNVTSILGSVGFENAPAYVAAKHGLEGLTKTAAIEYSAEGIRVNSVAPGFIETPMLEKAGITTDPETKKSIVSLHPIGRLGKPKEIADAIVWLCSDEASFITGHTLLADGGYTSR